MHDLYLLEGKYEYSVHKKFIIDGSGTFLQGIFLNYHDYQNSYNKFQETIICSFLEKRDEYAIYGCYVKIIYVIGN